MSNCHSVYCLPFLHRELAAISDKSLVLSEEIKHIWPGLPHMPKDFYWAPDNYIFDFITSEHCMKDLDAMGEIAMSGVSVHSLALGSVDARESKKRQELNDLKTFAKDGLISSSQSGQSGQSGQVTVDAKTIFGAAQKLLLWVWLLEKKVLEMRSLMNKYSEQASSTIDPLFVDEEIGMSTLLNMEYQLADTAAPLPSWRLVLENAAVFLPDNSIIFVSCSQMMSDLQEILDFQQGTAEIMEICAKNSIDNYDIIQAQSLVFKALGKKSNVNKYFGLDKSFTFVILRGLNESISC